jgi:hypothetical protein
MMRSLLLLLLLQLKTFEEALRIKREKDIPPRKARRDQGRAIQAAR